MPIDKPTAEALAVVAIASRPAGATRWDAAGILAALRKVHHLEAGEVAATVVRGRVRPEPRHPSRDREPCRALLEARQPQPEQLDTAPTTSRPSVLSLRPVANPLPLRRWPHPEADDPHPRPADSPDLQAKIAAIRAQLAGTTKPRESDLSDEQDPDHTNPTATLPTRPAPKESRLGPKETTP